MSDLSRRDFRRILIIKPSSPGDIIHALPVLRGLRRRYPQAHIAWLVATSFANLLEVDPALDEIIPFDRRHYGRVGRSLPVTREFVRFLGELRKRRFDLVVDLQGLFRSGFMAFSTGAGTRIGPRRTREFACLFYNRRIPATPADSHAVQKNYALAKLLGLAASPPDCRVAFTDEDRNDVCRLLIEAGIGKECGAGGVSAEIGKKGSVQAAPNAAGTRADKPPVAPARPVALQTTRPPGHRFAVLVPATRWETKCWPPDRYGLLARIIRDRHGLRSVLVGGAMDVEAGEKAVAASAEAAVNLCGKTTLRQLGALVDHAAIVVTADSTPMHMAAAQGRPLVALFGPTNPKRTGPHGRIEDVVRLDLPCSPCYFRKLSQCPYGHACMEELSVEQVASEVERRLGPCDPSDPTRG